MTKFRIRLKPIHDKTGLTPYAVAKRVGITQNSVRKYVDAEYVDSNMVYSVVVDLARFYGVDWRSPEIVEVIDEPDIA